MLLIHKTNKNKNKKIKNIPTERDQSKKSTYCMILFITVIESTN